MSPSSDGPFISLRTGHPENDLTDYINEDNKDAAADDRNGVEATDIESMKTKVKAKLNLKAASAAAAGRPATVTCSVTPSRSAPASSESAGDRNGVDSSLRSRTARTPLPYPHPYHPVIPGLPSFFVSTRSARSAGSAPLGPDRAQRVSNGGGSGCVFERA